MGCCLSKTQDFNPNPPAASQFKPSASHPLPESNSHPLRGPLSPVFEEESVKEVLSETPKPKPKPKPKPQPQPQPQDLIPIPLQEDKKKKEEEDKNISTPTKIEEEKQILSPIKIVEEKRVDSVNVAVSEDLSEVSEICSLSGSISTTVTERKDDEDGEVSQPRVHRSPAKRIRKRPIPGEFVSRHDRGSKSPARRLNNPSPVRRNDANQEMGTRRRIAENNRARRESIERTTTRRSRSPATRTNASATATNRAVIGRSPSKRAVAPRSPARAPAAKPPDNERKVEQESKEGKETNESIENPLVSMECFIFL